MKFIKRETKAPNTQDLSFKTEDILDAEDGKTALIVGLSAGFNNIDSWNEIIEPGAFTKTIKSNPNWPVLRHHDPNIKIGFSSEAEEVTKGLKTVSIISLDTQDGREQVALSRLAFSIPKAKDAQSIGFSVDSSRVEDVKKERIKFLEVIDMWEHSFVTWGANDKAESTGFKSWLPTEQDGFGLEDYVDEFFKFMESLKHNHKEVRDIMLKEKNEKNASAEIIKLMNESISILKS